MNNPFIRIAAGAVALCIAGITHALAADSNLVYSVENSLVTITGLTQMAPGPVVIPVKLGGYSVGSIARAAFCSNTNITSLSFDTGSAVTNIGAGACQDCSAMVSAELPPGVKSIPAGLFSGCSALRSVVMPESAVNVGELSFANCVNLTALTLPESVVSLGESAFFNCQKLASLELPKSISAIPGQLFAECRSLSALEIPSLVTNIGYSAFFNCQTLKSCGLPSSLVTIAKDAFHGCSALASVVVRSPLLYVGDQSFYGCSNLQKAKFERNVTQLGESVFGCCPSLTGVYFASQVPSLDSGDGADMFAPGGQAEVYYLSGSGRWEASYCGVNTREWLPEFTWMGGQVSNFQMTVEWVEGFRVKLQACSDLASPNWTDMGSGTIADGICQFQDPNWTSYNQRYYRIQPFTE